MECRYAGLAGREAGLDAGPAAPRDTGADSQVAAPGASGQPYRQMVEQATEAMFLLDCADGAGDPWVAVGNAALAAALGLHGRALAGQSVAALLPPSVYREFIRHWRRCVSSGKPVAYEGELQRGHAQRAYHASLTPLGDGQGGTVRVAGVVRDITRQKALERTLRRREAAFRTLVEQLPDTVTRYDRRMRQVYANPRMLNLAGTAFPLPLYEQQIRAVFADGGERDFELRWQQGGTAHCAQVRLRPEFSPAGQVLQVLAVGHDVSEIDACRRAAHQQAYFDALTGLPNRAWLAERLRAALAAAPAAWPRRVGLMMLDLDHFKEINDSLGHDAGDELLCEAGRRLQDCLGGGAAVARLGGDEFALLLPAARCDGELGATAAAVLTALSAPFQVAGRELFVSASIGIAVYPDHGHSPDLLYRYADSAMYFAKRQGRNHYQFYTSELTAQLSARMALEAALRKACKNGELELHYQPQVDLRSGRVTGAEALLRWRRPGYGMVAPDQFIGAAEASGLIVEIGQWVLAQACACAVRWNRGGGAPLRVAVNLSSRQFIRNDLVGALRRVLADSGCQPAWLKLEITESLLLEDSTEVAAMLAALCALGVSIAIDDFGTGYSALSYLHRLPVNQIKIDRSFVSGVPADRGKSELVKAMLAIGTALRLETVAEGVDTCGQADYLAAHGCQTAQGYLFGKPMPPEQFEAMLAGAASGASGASAAAATAQA